MIRLTIPGAPVPKGRPRAVPAGSSIRTYTPNRTSAYENLVIVACRQAALVALCGAIQIRARFYFEWPKASQRKRQPLSAAYMAQGPDVDNLAKALLDGLQRACRGFDDRQVVRLEVEKWRCAQGEAARTEVEITELDGEDGRS